MSFVIALFRANHATHTSWLQYIETAFVLKIINSNREVCMTFTITIDNWYARSLNKAVFSDF